MPHPWCAPTHEVAVLMVEVDGHVNRQECSWSAPLDIQTARGMDWEHSGGKDGHKLGTFLLQSVPPLEQPCGSTAD